MRTDFGGEARTFLRIRGVSEGDVDIVVLLFSAVAVDAFAVAEIGVMRLEKEAFSRLSVETADPIDGVLQLDGGEGQRRSIGAFVRKISSAPDCS